MGLIFFTVCVFHVVCASSPLWPIPQIMSCKETLLPLCSRFKPNINISGSCSDHENLHPLLSEKAWQTLAFINANAYEFPVYMTSIDSKTNCVEFSQLNIVVKAQNCLSVLDLNLHTNENYTLYLNVDHSINSYAIDIHASTAFGVIQALKTLVQLFVSQFNPDRSNKSLYFTRHVPCHIEDWPNFKHRGLLLDTA